MLPEIISAKEATVYLQNRGIMEAAIIAEMVRGSQNRSIYIALQADTYTFIARNRKPSALDFRAEFEPLIERYVRQLEIPEKELLRVLAHLPFWDKEIGEQVLKTFCPKFSEATFTTIMGLACVLSAENNSHKLFGEIQAFLRKDSLHFPKSKLAEFLFDIYDKKLKNIFSGNLTPFERQLFEFAFDAGAETEDIQTFCLWFEHTSQAFEEAEEYELLLFLNEKFSALLSPIKNEFSIYYNFSLYKRIFYNTKLNKGYEARKILQSLSPAQMKEYKQLYPSLETFSKEKTPPQSTENEREKWQQKLNIGLSSDIEKGDLHYNLATQYLGEDDFDNAFFHIKESHKARKNVLGETHEDTVSCLILMGEYYQKKENTAEAIKHYQKALDISLKNDRHGQETAKLLFEIADMCIKRKDFQKSVDYFKRCLREWDLLGVELNEMIATCHFKIGYVYDEVRNWDPALQQYSTALQMRKILLGETHDKVADILHNIGTIYFNRGAFQEAIRYLKKAITVRIDVSNIVRRALALSYYNLALAYIKTNVKLEARNCLEKAVAIFDHIDDEDMKMKSKNMLKGL